MPTARERLFYSALWVAWSCLAISQEILKGCVFCTLLAIAGLTLGICALFECAEDRA